MNFYELSYHDYDISNQVMFVSEKKLSQEEWTSLCNSLVPEACEKVLAKADSWDGFQNITEEVVKLLEDRCFTKIKPIIHYFHGGYILHREEGKDDEEDKQLALIPPPLLERVYLQNDKVRERLDINYRDVDNTMSHESEK